MHGLISAFFEPTWGWKQYLRKLSAPVPVAAEIGTWSRMVIPRRLATLSLAPGTSTAVHTPAQSTRKRRRWDDTSVLLQPGVNLLQLLFNLDTFVPYYYRSLLTDHLSEQFQPCLVTGQPCTVIRRGTMSALEFSRNTRCKGIAFGQNRCPVSTVRLMMGLGSNVKNMAYRETLLHQSTPQRPIQSATATRTPTIQMAEDLCSIPSGSNCRTH